MRKTNRREFIKIAGTGSMAVVLTGTSALTVNNSRKIERKFNIEEQIDPWIELNMDNLASNVREVKKKRPAGCLS